MFEGILLIAFFIIGGLTALLALLFFVIAAFRKSKTMFKIGLGITTVPLLLYILTYWYYHIHIPELNKRVENAYAGTYVMLASSSVGNSGIKYQQQPQLILNTDNTFKLDQNDFTSFSGKGTWRAGATEDGHFEFRDNKNTIVFWAEPLNNNRLQIETEGLNTQTITFVK